MKKKEIIKNLLEKQTIKFLLITLIKWGNLTQEQMANLCQISVKQVQRILEACGARHNDVSDKGLNLVVYKEYPFSTKRLYAATTYAQRHLGSTKEIKDDNKKKLIPRFSTIFNFTDAEHTEFCIKALLKEFNGRTIKLSEYRTAREMAYMWSDVFKEIKDIWYAGVSDRKPDLIVWNKELDGWICIEIELTPKSVKRMRIILRSLHALGDYAKGFKQVKIYANEKTIVYKKWSNVLNFVDENDRPSDLHLLKLHELLN